MAYGSALEASALLTELEHVASAKLRLEIDASDRLLADLERGSVEGVEQATVAERRPVEEALLSEWARWYDQALSSVIEIPVSDDVSSLEAAVDSARARVSGLDVPGR